MDSGVVVRGHVKVIIADERSIKAFKFENKILDSYLARLAKWTAGVNNAGQNPAYPPTKFEFGTGTGTISGSDAALFTPAPSTLISISTVSYNAGVTTFTINYAKNAISGTFTEAGLQDVNGILLTHLKLTPNIEVVENQSVTVIYTVNFTSQ